MDRSESNGYALVVRRACKSFLSNSFALEWQKWLNGGLPKENRNGTKAGAEIFLFRWDAAWAYRSGHESTAIKKR